MTRLLTLSRAARLVGVTRGALQKKIKSGELPAFEGKVDAEDLLRVYPQAELENNAVVERMVRIKDNAYAKRLRERLLPNADVLAVRLQELAREQANTKALLDQYRAIVEQLNRRFGELESTGGEELRSAARSLKAWLGDWRETGPEEADYSQPLLLKDSFLRLMAAHVKIVPSGHEFFVEGADSILDAALHAGFSPDYGCSNGNCGSCKAKVVSGQVQKIRHHDYALTGAERSTGYILMCANTAVTDLVIEAPEAHGAKDIPVQHIAARVRGMQPLAEDTMLLRVQTPRTNRLRFLAGQRVTLSAGEGISREYPVASCPCDDRNLEFHVIRSPGDEFADTVFGRLKSSDTVSIDGPRGDFVLQEDAPRSLIFLACDAGFAPVKSLIEHAMALELAEVIHLYWFASGQRQHYMDNLCRSWADALENFHYTPYLVPLESEASRAGHSEFLRSAFPRVTENHPILSEFDVYAAGPEPFIGAAQTALLARGLPRSQFFADCTG